jgi:hypothetical protein
MVYGMKKVIDQEYSCNSCKILAVRDQYAVSTNDSS